ncbi:MAG TPA: malto-oligosyltrehalose trehalohydrolase [Usitatibacter sp.]|nr:malto-oligosyltrehalose trehalohydrolase [Usitatibacter sp.]
MRRLFAGAELQSDGSVHFRVWAPRRKRVEVVLEGSDGRSILLDDEGDGFFSAAVPNAGARALYRYRLDGEGPFPDPVSRFQPEGPHGPSQVIDPSAYRWNDREWHGVSTTGQVIYEMHIGTFTREGTWSAAMGELPRLAATGITVLELMPIAEFPGRFGWGYDGVDLYAPTHLYGEPDDVRRFVDEAHAAGLAVILDVVYNHLGPDGCYLSQFAPEYFTDRYKNEWGEPINFDGPGSGPVREFFAANAAYWIDEFHMDGLRLDATQQIFDASALNVMQEITQRVRDAARGRGTLVVAENEGQDTRLVRPVDEGGYGMDALWNDDFHHSAVVATTGRNEAYYSDYLGSPQEFVSAAKWGYLYQGQRFQWQGKRRGTPALGLPPTSFVNYTQNHDQVANSALGLRLHRMTSPGRYRAITALLLLSPGTPMLFQGQEFASSAPFLYFADHEPALAASVKKGRADFVRQFPTLATAEVQALLSDPDDPDTFQRSKLDLSEREKHHEDFALHVDLLRLRREDPAFRCHFPGSIDGAVLGPEAFVLRFFAEGHQERLLLVNLGRDLTLKPAPEPLLAPPLGQRWRTLWASDDPRYGGCGTAEPERADGWYIPGHAAVVLAPAQREPDETPK